MKTAASLLLKCAAWGCAAFLLLFPAVSAQAAYDPAVYTVTVTPYYRNPETGGIDDPGQNEAVGQGMTERLCGPKGLLELDRNGNLYLTVRYYLSQFVSDVTFEEGHGDSFSSRSFQRMQVVPANENASDIEEKYGYTDYRMQISDDLSLFRGGAYIEPMGRSVIYFFNLSNPVKGSSDFIVSIDLNTVSTPPPEPSATPEQAAVPELVEGPTSTIEGPASTVEEPAADETYRSEPVQEIAIVDDPVPEQDNVTTDPLASPYGGGGSEAAGEGLLTNPDSAAPASVEPLITPYDLSTADAASARALVAPILDNATGITLITDGTDVASLSYESAAGTNLITEEAAPLAAAPARPRNRNLIIMLVLIMISALIIAAVSAIRLYGDARRS